MTTHREVVSGQDAGVAMVSDGSTDASSNASQSQAKAVAAMMPGGVVTLNSGNDVVQVTAPATVMQTGGSHTIMSDHGGITINATGGNSVIHGGMDGDLVNEGPDCMFIGAVGGGVSTVNASPGGTDTIIAVTGMDYHGEQGAHSLFIGGSAAVTVSCAADQTLFAGTGGGIYGRQGQSFLCRCRRGRYDHWRRWRM